MNRYPTSNFVNISSAQKHFYMNLKREGLSQVSPEKIEEIREFADFFASTKANNFKVKFFSAIEKAYLSASTKVISYGLDNIKTTIKKLKIENDAEILLFILFATDPSFELFYAFKDRTIQEAITYCRNNLDFWDSKLVVLEQRYLNMVLSKQNNMNFQNINNDDEFNSILVKNKSQL